MANHKCNRGEFCVALTFGILCISSIPLANFAVAQPTKYDGVYAGSQTLSETGPVKPYSQCLKGPFKRKLVVKAGTVLYVYNPTYQGQVTGTVDENGDVAATDSTGTGGVSLAGKIQGDDFAGEVWSIYCTYSLEMKRVP